MASGTDFLFQMHENGAIDGEQLQTMLDRANNVAPREGAADQHLLPDAGEEVIEEAGEGAALADENGAGGKEQMNVEDELEQSATLLEDIVLPATEARDPKNGQKMAKVRLGVVKAHVIWVGPLQTLPQPVGQKREILAEKPDGTRGLIELLRDAATGTDHVTAGNTYYFPQTSAKRVHPDYAAGAEYDVILDKWEGPVLPAVQYPLPQPPSEQRLPITVDNIMSSVANDLVSVEGMVKAVGKSTTVTQRRGRRAGESFEKKTMTLIGTQYQIETSFLRDLAKRVKGAPGQNVRVTSCRVESFQGVARLAATRFTEIRVTGRNPHAATYLKERREIIRMGPPTTLKPGVEVKGVFEEGLEVTPAWYQVTPTHHQDLTYNTCERGGRAIDTWQAPNRYRCTKCQATFEVPTSQPYATFNLTTDDGGLIEQAVAFAEVASTLRAREGAHVHAYLKPSGKRNAATMEAGSSSSGSRAPRTAPSTTWKVIVEQAVIPA